MGLTNWQLQSTLLAQWGTNLPNGGLQGQRDTPIFKGNSITPLLLIFFTMGSHWSRRIRRSVRFPSATPQASMISIGPPSGSCRGLQGCIIGDSTSVHALGKEILQNCVAKMGNGLGCNVIHSLFFFLNCVPGFAIVVCLDLHNST